MRAIPKIVRVELVVQAMQTPSPELTSAISTMSEPPLHSRSASTNAGAVGELASASRSSVPQPICRPQAHDDVERADQHQRADDRLRDQPLRVAGLLTDRGRADSKPVKAKIDSTMARKKPDEPVDVAPG